MSSSDESVNVSLMNRSLDDDQSISSRDVNSHAGNRASSSTTSLNDMHITDPAPLEFHLRLV